MQHGGCEQQVRRLLRLPIEQIAVFPRCPERQTARFCEHLCRAVDPLQLRARPAFGQQLRGNAGAAAKVVNALRIWQVNTVEQFIDRALPETGKLLVRLGVPVGCCKTRDH
ncbi:hypothetical protein D3C81_2045980 [compost metagenome]